MRQSIIGLATLVALGCLASDAWAAKVNFTATVSQVRAGCSKGGGTFGAHIDGGGYGCSKANCDGKGGKCEVHCTNNNQCTGTTPSRVFTGMGIPQILTNGKAAGAQPTDAPDNILGGYGSGGLAPQKPSAAGTPPAAPRPNAPPPQVIR